MKKKLLIITFFGLLLTSVQILKCALTTGNPAAQSPHKEQVVPHLSTETEQPNPDLNMLILSKSKEQAITELLTPKKIKTPENKRFIFYKRRADLVDIALWEKPRSIFKRNNMVVGTADLGSQQKHQSFIQENNNQLVAALILARIAVFHAFGTTPELRPAALYGAGIGFASQILSTLTSPLEYSESHYFRFDTKKPQFSLNPVLATTMVFPAMIFIAQSLKNFSGLHSVPHELITAPLKKGISNLWEHFGTL